LTCGVIRSFYYHSLNIGFSCKFYHHPILWVSHHIQNLPSSSLVAGFTPTICPFVSEHARWMGNLIAESKSTYRAVEIHPFRGCDICPFTPCLRQISDKLKSFPLRDHLAEISCGVHTPQSSLCKDGSYRFCVLLLGISFRCRIWWSPAGWLFFSIIQGLHERARCWKGPHHNPWSMSLFINNRGYPAMWAPPSDVCWWFQPLWKILVSWDYYSQYMESHKVHVPNHQMSVGFDSSQ
jgi:hypothetical protein